MNPLLITFTVIMELIVEELFFSRALKDASLIQISIAGFDLLVVSLLVTICRIASVI